MPGFEALYKQTVTLFNRKWVDGSLTWYPFVLRDVHLVIDKSIIISTYGEQCQDNARVHIQYSPRGGKAVVSGKTYLMPKEWERVGDPETNFTLGYGDEFDFIMEGVYSEESASCDVESKAQVSASVNAARWKESGFGVTGTYTFVYDNGVWKYNDVAVGLSYLGVTVEGEPEDGDTITVKYVSPEGPISDDDYRIGFYNYMNKTHDNVFAISTVSKFNLIPHFEVGAR